MKYEKLVGNNIILRKAVITDYQSMLKNVWSDEEVYKWMLFTPTYTDEEAIERCKRSMRFQENNYGYFVALKDTNEAIGLCAVKEYEENRYEECGICIGKAYQGKGYGSEILELLLDLCFNKLNGKDFKYGYFIENEKSKSLALKYKFKYLETIELKSPWDGIVKTIDNCLLTKEEYLNK